MLRDSLGRLRRPVLIACKKMRFCSAKNRLKPACTPLISVLPVPDFREAILAEWGSCRRTWVNQTAGRKEALKSRCKTRFLTKGIFPGVSG